MSEGTLVVPAARPSADALVAELFRVESARLVSMARWFVDDRTAAEDLVHEAFIRLAANAYRIQTPTVRRRTCARS